MRIRALLLGWCLAATMSAQITEVELGHSQNELFIDMHHNASTGTLILQSAVSYWGINVHEQKAWSVDRFGLDKLGATFGDESSEDYVSYGASGLVFAAGKLLDAGTGTVVFEGDRMRRKWSKMLEDGQILLFKGTGPDSDRIYCVDVEAKSLRWQLDVARSASDGLATIVGDNMVVFRSGRSLYAVDLASGKERWNVEKYNPSYIASVGDQLVAAEGDELQLIDRSDGSMAKKAIKVDANVVSVQEHDRGLLVIHNKGFNIYQPEVGEWTFKKGFDQRGVKQVKDLADGTFEVTYEFMGLGTYRRIKVGADGKKAEKRARSASWHPHIVGGFALPDGHEAQYRRNRTAVISKDGEVLYQFRRDQCLYDEEKQIVMGFLDNQIIALTQHGLWMLDYEVNEGMRPHVIFGHAGDNYYLRDLFAIAIFSVDADGVNVIHQRDFEKGFHAYASSYHQFPTKSVLNKQQKQRLKESIEKLGSMLGATTQLLREGTYPGMVASKNPINYFVRLELKPTVKTSIIRYNMISDEVEDELELPQWTDFTIDHARNHLFLADGENIRSFRLSD